MRDILTIGFCLAAFAAAMALVNKIGGLPDWQKDGVAGGLALGLLALTVVLVNFFDDLAAQGDDR